MNFDTTFLHWFHLIADTIVVTTGFTAVIKYVIFPKRLTKIGLQINIFMEYLFRSLLIFISWLLVYGICNYIYGFFILFDPKSYEHGIWNNDHPIPYIIGYLISVILGIILAWLSALTIWRYNPIKLFFNLFRPADKQIKTTGPELKIIKGEYVGYTKGFNKTDYLKGLVENNKLEVMSSNGLFDDPEEGIPKKLIIDWSYGHYYEKSVVPENYTITIENGVSTISPVPVVFPPNA